MSHLPLRQLARNSPEQRAIAAGEIDAVIDYAGRNVILLPCLRHSSSGKTHRHGAPGNSVLAALSRKDYLGLIDALEPAALTHGSVLYEPGEPIEHVFFPITCLVSILATLEGGESMEVCLVGREGVVGVPLALGIAVSPGRRVVVRQGGAALRIKAPRFRKAFRECLPLQRELCRCAAEKLALARQIVVCNRFHTVEARVARWLLMTADRVLSEEVQLTQAVLAEMLGERRASVNEAAGTLQRQALIDFVRGRIRILDRKRLEAASCRCYAPLRPSARVHHHLDSSRAVTA